MGIIKRVVNAYAGGFPQERWDDLFSAGMLGAAVALDTFDESKGDIKHHINRGVRNHVLMELRKIKRWDNETPFAHLIKTEYQEDSFDDDDSNDIGTPFDVNRSSSIWKEEDLNPEEKTVQKETIERVNDRIADIIPALTEREQYVFWNNIHTDSPVSIREIARQFRVGKSSIHRDRKRVINLLKEEY